MPDPRKKKGKRHPLKAILGLIVIGLMCNQKSYTAIATWGRTQPKLAKALDFRDAKTPCAATFHNLLKNLNTLDLEHSLTQWVTQTYQGLPPVFASRLTAVSIDGKTLRGSKDPETGNPTHLLAAVSHELGIPLAQCAVSEKTNEGFPISRQLLKAFDVRQKVVTTDALLTQRRFCEEIIAHEADYLLPVKGNQKGVYQDIQDLFEPFSETETQEVQTRRFASLHTQEGAHLDTHIAVEKAHGFLTTRTLTASTLLTEHSDWPGLAQVYQYTRLSASISAQGNHTADAVWHHESRPAGCLRRRLTHPPTRALDHRKQSPLDPRCRFRRRCLTGSNRRNPASHGGIAQHRPLCFAIQWVCKDLPNATIFRSTT